MNRIPTGSANVGSGRTQPVRVPKSSILGGALRRMVVVLGSVALAGSIFSIYAGSSAAANAPTTVAPFNECPGVGHDSGCAFLIILNPNGTADVVPNPAEGPFDGNDDTLVGIFNNSGATVATIGLSASTDIFGFDGDGICGLDHGKHYTWVGTGLNGGGFSAGNGFSGCPYGNTGYEGPYVSFSGYSKSTKYETGNVNFSMPGGGGLTTGSTTFFSLESKLNAANFSCPRRQPRRRRRRLRRQRLPRQRRRPRLPHRRRPRLPHRRRPRANDDDHGCLIDDDRRANDDDHGCLIDDDRRANDDDHGCLIDDDRRANDDDHESGSDIVTPTAASTQRCDYHDGAT